MWNFKHALSAIAAVAMVGSLAANQAADLTGVNAQETKPAEIQQPVILAEEIAEEIPVEEEKEESNKGYVIITDGYLNLRSENSTESESEAQLECAAEVTILMELDEWYHVMYQDKVGYVYKEYITKSYDEARRALVENFKYETAVVSADGVNIRNGAGTDATEVVDQAVSGAKLYILENVNDEWVKVYYGNDYSIGYVNKAYISAGELVDKAEIEKARTERINEIERKAEEARKKKAEEEKKAQENAKKAKEAEKVQPQKAVEKKSASGVSGQAIVNEAAKYIGTRYVYGGNSPSTGFDCSGLVQYACRKVGISVNRSSKAQYNNGYAVSRDELQPGDLVFFSKGSGISHVVIYAGDGKVLHAPSAGKTVCYTTLSHICSYSKYVGARRVV